MNEKAKRPNWYEISLKLHKKYRGKIEVFPKVPIKGITDLSVWYTPGVAEPSRRIKENPELSFRYTFRWNYVAVVSNGTRVLGLGKMGPTAAFPVMEGKALLFKYLGGVDAVPILINERDPEKFVKVVKALEYSFGAINLEDIESPQCFYILDKLSKELDIPVWHDDQQGTALIVLSALINAFKVVGKDLRNSRIVLYGMGAANYAILRMLRAYGVNTEKILVVERPGIGILGRNHPLLNEFRSKMPHWYEASLITNKEGVDGPVEKAFEGADAVIAASKPGPGVIKKEWVRKMAENSIVFSLANPTPEILPEEAKEAGAKVIATGRSDYPNQVNNSLGFPAVFRGALTVQARKMTEDMFFAAAEALAKHAEEKGLKEDYIIPAMNDSEAYIKEAMAVALEAVKEGIARTNLSLSELTDEIHESIMRPKKYMRLMLNSGFIKS